MSAVGLISKHSIDEYFFSLFFYLHRLDLQVSWLTISDCSEYDFEVLLQAQNKQTVQ